MYLKGTRKDTLLGVGVRRSREHIIPNFSFPPGALMGDVGLLPLFVLEYKDVQMEAMSRCAKCVVSNLQSHCECPCNK